LDNTKFFQPNYNKFTLFNIPVEQKSSFKKINELKIANKDYWSNKELKSIKIGYCRANFFNETFAFLERIINKLRT
jgi:hypothetical protein